jgi:hypothetical protein
LKRRFRILSVASEYNLDIQSWIPTALCAIHNFIQQHDSDEGELPRTNYFHDDEHFQHAIVEEDHTGAGLRRDQIAQQMWEDYVALLNERGIEMLVDSDVDSDNSF